MDDPTLAARFRQHHVTAFRESDVSMREYCRRPDTPCRTTLTKWIRRSGRGGLSELTSRRPRRCSWNRTSLADEARVLEYVLEAPGHGAQRIANELRGQIEVGHNGVHGILKRRQINRHRDRLEWVRKAKGEVVTQSELERARQKAKRRHLEVAYPGEVWGQDTFLIGRLKGVGRIYHYIAVDIASSYAVASLYTARTAENACDFLHNHLLEKSSNVGVHRLLQDNGTEYTAARWKDRSGNCNHPFHEEADRLGIKLTFIKPRHAWTNGSCERIHQTLLREFYQPALVSKIYTSIEELDYDLQLYLSWYNRHRTHQGFRLKGRTPASVFFSKTPRLNNP
jgi:transposase InsO family protein